MRLRSVPVTALAVLGLSLLTACQPAGLDEADPSITGGTVTATPSVSPTASQPGTPTPSPSSAPAPSRSGAPAPSSSARRVVEADRAGGLPKLTGEGALTDVPIDPGDMRDGMNLVAAKYARTDEQGRTANVLVVAVDNVPEDTSTRQEYLMRGMLDHIKWDQQPPEAEPVADPGPLGGSVECLLASFTQDGDVICGWSDARTAGVVHFPNSSLPRAEKLVVAMRSDLEK
ncbi:hypothetical protein [Streptomyces sp. NPDC004284]|uniref:hypothetical protein n=1 Tax=Streptomyces sp. NPDC004284 TaxID=3364695 RepID=UPI003682F1D3